MDTEDAIPPQPGCAFLAKQMYSRALEEFAAALEIEPDDQTARQAVSAIKRKLN